MDGYLKQSTASQVRWVGPFLDDTDFKTAETGLTVANTDIKVSKNGGASASKNSGGGTHDTNGMYAVTWDATDTATVGELKYSIKVAGALPVFGSYVVVEEAIYAMLFDASAVGYISNAPVNVEQWHASNVSVPTNAGVPNVNAKTWNDLTTVALPLVPTTAGRTLDVSAGGEGGVDWANVGSPTTTVGLSGTTVKTATDVETDTQDIQARLPAALTSGGRIKASVEAILDTAFTEGAAGRIAAAFKQFFNIATPAATMDHGVLTDTVTTLTNAPSDSSGVTTLLGKFTGMTSLTQWLGLLGGKQSGNSTARTEVRATGAGSGTFDETTDSQEALRDNMGTAQTGDSYARIGAAGASLSAIPWNASWDAEVQSEVTDALAAMFEAARAEPGQGAPAVNATALAKLDYLYKFLRNKITQDATTLKVYADDGTTVDHKATVSDDGTTYTRGEIATGP